MAAFTWRLGRLGTGALVVGLLASGCSSGTESGSPEPSPIATTSTAAAQDATTPAEDRLAELTDAPMFVGGVAFTSDLIAMNLDRTDPDNPALDILVTDGTPGGHVEWFEGVAEGGNFDFTSASGDARIQGAVEPVETHGTVTFADGVEHVFFTRPAGHGAGIFEIGVDAAGAWEGEALDGSTLTAQQDGARVVGEVVTPDGDRFPIAHEDMTRRLGYEVEGGQPDDYVAVVTRRGTEVVGRGGGLEALRAGEPASDNVLALDLPAAEYEEPGIYYGRLAGSSDRTVFEISDVDGGRRLRAYVSDSEPEPEGDIEWFTGMLDGDTFSLTSPQGIASVEGTIADDGISGTMTLPDREPQRFFVAPAGDGAGIYDVTVGEDRAHVGTSTRGDELSLEYLDDLVMGTITSATGQVFDLVGADLSDAYEYEADYSQPGAYVAFAAPRGRFLFGRNGDVRGGRPGVNIIGLDKKC